MIFFIFFSFSDYLNQLKTMNKSYKKFWKLKSFSFSTFSHAILFQNKKWKQTILAHFNSQNCLWNKGAFKVFLFQEYGPLIWTQ